MYDVVAPQPAPHSIRTSQGRCKLQSNPPQLEVCSGLGIIPDQPTQFGGMKISPWITDPGSSDQPCSVIKGKNFIPPNWVAGPE